MRSPLHDIVALWIAWLLIWLASAPFTARTAVRQPLAAFLADRALLSGGAILLMVHGSSVLFRPLGTGVWERWACAAAVAAGLAFAVWARLRLGRNWSHVAVLKEDHALVRAGPYARVRHPIYSGMLLALAGTALAVATPAGLAGLALLAAGFVLRIRREEALLLGHFGDAYRAYQAEVPALVPRLAARGVR